MIRCDQWLVRYMIRFWNKEIEIYIYTTTTSQNHTYTSCIYIYICSIHNIHGRYGAYNQLLIRFFVFQVQFWPVPLSPPDGSGPPGCGVPRFKKVAFFGLDVKYVLQVNSPWLIHVCVEHVGCGLLCVYVCIPLHTVIRYMTWYRLLIESSTFCP